MQIREIDKFDIMKNDINGILLLNISDDKIKRNGKKKKPYWSGVLLQNIYAYNIVKHLNKDTMFFSEKETLRWILMYIRVRFDFWYIMFI